MTTVCEEIARRVGEMFVCSPHDRYVRVRTPFLYPDGDVIDLFVRQRNGNATVTDLGETLGWLRMQTPSERRTDRQRQLVQDVCVTHNVELFKGALVTRSPSDEIATAVVRLSQAAVRVADIWFTLRTRAVQSIADEVAEHLTEREIPYERSEKIPGRSGRVWTVDFHVRAAKRSSLVYVLTSGSRAAARRVCEHVLSGWYDLSHLKLGGQAMGFVSLFDDTLDVWSEEDFKLLDDLSEIGRWSRPDDFDALIEAA